MNHAQYNLLFLKSDTVTYKERTGGTSIDSLDWYHAASFATNPGGAWNNLFGRNSSNYLEVISYFQNQVQPLKPIQSKFTALPHLGFMYSFGSKGLQYVHVDYQQTFKNNTNLSFRYDKNSLSFETGFIRNNSFSNNSIQFLIDHKSKKYESLFYMNFLNSKRGLSNGILTDTLIDQFGLQYTPVLKNTANSVNKNFQLGTQHAFNFSGDSLFRHGFVYKNQWSIQNRVYLEGDQATNLKSIYDHIYIDSFATRDQFQTARINNAGGYFFKADFLKVEALIQHGYWKYQNLGKYRDTSEIDFQGNVEIKIRQFIINNSVSINLMGAIGNWSNILNASFQQKKWSHNFNFSSISALPNLFQRAYFSNNYQWHLNGLKPQNQTGINYQIHHKSKFDLTGQIGWKHLKNTYFFRNSTWSNDTLQNINIVSASVRGTLNWKTLYWQPQIIYSVVPDNFQLIPQFDIRSKLFFNKKIFKAKKLDFILGIDLRYQAKYQLADYLSNIDLYTLPSSNTSHTPVLKLDFFTGFQIDEFRFYLKFENIDYFWNPRTNLQQLGYPVAPNVIRLGLTWDFFN